MKRLFVLILMLSFVFCLSAVSWSQEEEEIQALPAPLPAPLKTGDKAKLKPSLKPTKVMMLQDGNKLSLMNVNGKEQWYLMKKDGTKTLADGSFKLKSGKSINTKNGLLLKKMPAGKLKKMRSVDQMQPGR